MGAGHTLTKPLLRGHFHQAGFFVAIGAVAMLIAQSHGVRAVTANLVYGLSLITLFGVSALYHRPQWSEKARARMRRLDHSAIFILIAGTGTPIFLLGMEETTGMHLLLLVWAAAGAGVIQSLFWIHAPKWLAAILYLLVGWLVLPYLPELKMALGSTNLSLIIAGGAVYTAGALVYAFKWPNPWPKVFGYHEIFHLLVMIAAMFHFMVIANIAR